MQIPKAKEDHRVTIGNNKDKETAGFSDEQMLGDDTSGIESSRRREVEDENFNNDYSKFPSDTSSSDFTQATPTETGTADDFQAPFISDEANSAANMYSLGVDFTSNLIQVHYYYQN